MELLPTSSQQSRQIIDLSFSAKDLSDGTQSASWSTIADEGLVLLLSGHEPKVFYGHFGYVQEITSVTGPFTLPDGSTPGFTSQCNRIPHGWMINRVTSTLHCFSAEQLSHSSQFQPPKPVTPHPSLRSATPASYRIPNWELAPSSPSHLHVQGSCGSCFVLSFAYAFERIIKSEYLHSHIPHSPVVLDRESILSCSYSNQGCSGGFFPALALDLMVTGAPLSGCLDNSPEDQLSYTTNNAQQCDKTCYSENSLYYTAGYSELKSEAEIMKFLIQHGPVPVGVYMTQEHHVDLMSGIDKIIDLPNNDHPVDGWDYINHGLVIIGWGTSGEGKYWDVYNPWGGRDTFVKISRHADGVTERNAIGIKVDGCRGKFGVDKDKRRSGTSISHNCN